MRLRRSRLTETQSKRLVEHFVAGTPARPAAELVGVNRNTARLFYHRLRVIIAQRLAQASPLKGEVRVEESHFRAAGKVPVFGLIERGSKVYTVMVLEAWHEPPPATPQARVRLDSIVCTDLPGDRAVLDVSRFRHQRVDEGERLARGRAHIDRTENFWNQAKRHLHRYNGVPRRHFHLFLKECEWRFNYGPPRNLLKTLKSWIKTSSG